MSCAMNNVQSAMPLATPALTPALSLREGARVRGNAVPNNDEASHCSALLLPGSTGQRTSELLRFPLSMKRLALIASVTLLALFAAAADKPVSFYNDIIPVFKRSCSGCHHPGKLKGQLDLTTYDAFKKGGKHGPAFVAGNAKDSVVIDEISGDEPSMPKEGDPLNATEIAMIQRWILEGSHNDTPADAGSFKLAAPPTYTALPVITAIAFSPQGNVLAVSGYHETLLLLGAQSNQSARLVGQSPRIESLTFSPDGKKLAVAGSAPARFGEVQIWDAGATGTVMEPLKSFKVATDSIYGISWSPDGG